MSLNYVTVKGTLRGATSGEVIFTASNWETSPSDSVILPPIPVAADVQSDGTWSAVLLATDSTGPVPAGWSWSVEFIVPGIPAEEFSFFLLFANGASQDMSTLVQASPSPALLQYLPVPSGGPVAGQVPVATGVGETSVWGSAAQPSWVSLPGNWYSGPWFTAKANISSSPAWILFDGDSVTNGVNPANNGFLATGWPDQLRTSLVNANFPVYGDFYPLWSYTEGSGALDPVNEGFQTLLTGASTFEGGFGTCLSCGSSNAWMQIIDTSLIPGWTGGHCTGFDIVWYDWGVCTWEFIIDGGQGGSPTVTGATWNGSAWVATGTGGAATAGNMRKVTVRGLSSSTHTIEHGQVSNAGNMMPVGISLFTGNTGGVGYVRSAYSGRRAVDSATPGGANLSYSGTLTAFPNDRPSLWSGSGPTNATAQITPTPFGFPTQPTLAFIAYGINDCATYVSPEAYGDAIERKIIAIRRGVANANIGLMAMSYPDIHNSDNNLAGNGGRYLRWKRVLAELAESYNCALIDIDSKWGGTPVGQGFQVSGNVHPTTAGSADIAAVVRGII